jgi:4-hydroxybenzoate polyprenyltransferase
MSFFVEYFKLMRLDKPVGFMLLFLPCAFGLALASHFTGVSLWEYVLFLYGSITMRAAGCIINDIIDRDIDRKVARTKNRPIASGKIQVFEASLLVVLLFIAGAIILLSLSRSAVYIGVFSTLLIVLYPLMKRVINYPQFFLGITFNIGVIISFIHATKFLDWSVLLLYVGCVFWTFGYDTIYGYQDKKDDKKIGVKSAAISFDKHSTMFLLGCYGVFWLILLFIGIYTDRSYIYYFILMLTAIHMLWQIITLDKHSPGNCLAKFKSNVLLGAVVLLALLF